MFKRMPSITVNIYLTWRR